MVTTVAKMKALVLSACMPYNRGSQYHIRIDSLLGVFGVVLGYLSRAPLLPSACMSQPSRGFAGSSS
jgi:hypothetical protein